MADSFNADRRRLINKGRVEPEIVLDIGDAQKKSTMAFVLTVMSALSGTAASRQPTIDKRKLHQVRDRRGLNQLFRQFKPEIEKFIKNHLPGADGDLKLLLKFESMKDFEIESLIRQIPALNALYEKRAALVRLRDTVSADEDKKKSLAALPLNDEIKQALARS